MVDTLEGRGLEGLWAALESGPRPILMLDYDGTLAPFREDRDSATPYPGVRDVLEAILESGECRLVVVSGRAVAALRPLLGLDATPELWGSHGWERFVPGESRVRGPDFPAEAARQLARGLEEAVRIAPSRRIEKKPASVAVHFRGMEGRKKEELEELILSSWRPMVAAGSLTLDAFDGGLELKVPGRDKGFAVHRILAREPAEAAAAYLGDDLTDEDAFRALAGRGIGILVRSQDRPSAADFRIAPPGELLEFLRRWHRHLIRRKEERG